MPLFRFELLIGQFFFLISTVRIRSGILNMSFPFLAGNSIRRNEKKIRRGSYSLLGEALNQEKNEAEAMYQAVRLIQHREGAS